MLLFLMLLFVAFVFCFMLMQMSKKADENARFDAEVADFVANEIGYEYEGEE